MLLKPHFTIYQKVRLPACGLLWLTCWPVTLLWLHNLGKNDFWKPLEHISFNWFFSHSWSFHKVFNGSGNCQWCILFQWCTAGCPATGRGHNSSLVSTVYILVDLAHKINCEFSLLSVLFCSKQSKTLCRWYRRGQPRQKLTGKSCQMHWHSEIPDMLCTRQKVSPSAKPKQNSNQTVLNKVHRL